MYVHIHMYIHTHIRTHKHAYIHALLIIIPNAVHQFVLCYVVGTHKMPSVL